MFYGLVQGFSGGMGASRICCKRVWNLNFAERLLFPRQQADAQESEQRVPEDLKIKAP
jgi:hypothetical protein